MGLMLQHQHHPPESGTGTDGQTITAYAALASRRAVINSSDLTSSVALRPLASGRRVKVDTHKQVFREDGTGHSSIGQTMTAGIHTAALHGVVLVDFNCVSNSNLIKSNN